MKKNNKVTIGLIQTNVSNNIAANMEKTAQLVKEAAQNEAKIICLQELYRTKYFPQKEKKDVAKFAETIPGESTDLFSKLAKKLKVVIIAPIFENTNGNFYNSAVVIDKNGKLLNTYRKVHIPRDQFFYEKNYFKAGNFGYPVYKTSYAAFSVLICYDQWFPEAARICALKGADILFYPTAIGWIKGEKPKDDWHNGWETIQRSHAIANGIYVAAVNRVGKEENLNFWGSSFVCNSFGKIIKKASKNREEALVAELDLSKNKEIREGWGFLRNRRPDTYAPICAALKINKD